jgi:hypothetical protein
MVVFVCMILIASALPVLGTIDKEEIPTNLKIYGASANHLIVSKNKIHTSYGALFKQSPRDPEDDLKNCYTSDSGTYNIKAFEDFWNITSPIRGINWWGFSMKWIGFGWKSLNPEGMKIDITFYEDNDSAPGPEVYSYENIEYTVSPTGIFYEWFGGDLHNMLYFETQLNPYCELYNGWVSIESTYHPNGSLFLWMNSADGNSHAFQYQPPMTELIDDLAFILTDDEPDLPDLGCYGSLIWADVVAGSTVEGNFTVANIGSTGTLLDWEIVDEPSWGNWTFEPNSYEDLEPGTPVIVQVSLVTPEELNSEFSGEIKIVNKENNSDNCTIPVILTTPKIKPFNSQYNWINWLFEHFPNAFTILRYLLNK